MVRKRAKQNKLSACGCNRAVKPSRIEAGKSWRILVVRSYLVFLTTACVVAAAQANTTWRPALAAALRAYVGGRGTRGVVAAALQTVEELEHGAAIGVGNPAGLHAHGDRFDDSALHVYMDLLLLGFLEWHVRLGFRQAAAWCRKLLNLSLANGSGNNNDAVPSGRCWTRPLSFSSANMFAVCNLRWLCCR